jgi:vacuolar-type H+-ATPase catalytic subunit A/Vma1
MTSNAALVFNEGILTIVPAGDSKVQPLSQPVKKETVLAEDLYGAAVSKLIERDFFPDLPVLRMKAELREAVQSGNRAKILELQSELSRISKSSCKQHSLCLT